MVHHSLIIAIDLGTSATTANHARVRDSFDDHGKLRRVKLGSVFDVKDWPGCIEGATGNVCFPTDLIYHRVTRELLFCGFEAQQYLDDDFHDIPHTDVFVVETIKLLLPNPDEARVPSVACQRYRAMREALKTALGKEPAEVFEDFLSFILGHVLHNATRKYSIGLHNHHLELVLAFPSGWPDQVHTAVAAIGSRALQKAIAKHGLRNTTFGLEKVYTVSETMCGVKEWFRETVAEEASSIDYEPHPANLDELNEGDSCLAVDIGGGTGCLTALKLVSKSPLGVEQLDRTESLEASGAAVDAQFERGLRPRITHKDYPGDVERLVYQICRKFKEEKKKCGTSLGPGFETWKYPVNRLKANTRKGFEKNCMRFDRKQLDDCFDPVIDVLEKAIEKTTRKFPSIKTIVFLGQFGGTSAYLQKRMVNSVISSKVKLRYSQSGKLDVVKGAISARLSLEETFIRRFKTLRSYGTLVTLVYSEEVSRIFPDPQEHGALPFEHANDGLRLKVIEWALPKETIVEDGRAHDVGRDGLRHHTWPFSEQELGFEDIIVVSDEDVPAPQLHGMSYTLWTHDHENNQLYIAGQRMQVQQIPFCWDLNMSQKLDAEGNIVGPYERDDLKTAWSYPNVIKGRRRNKLRELHYDLIWDITEMQVKVHVRATFPNQVGLPLFQLAKEQALGPDEKTITGESRSKALDKDIEIANGATEEDEETSENQSEGPLQSQQANGPARQHQRQRETATSQPNSGICPQTVGPNSTRAALAQAQAIRSVPVVIEQQSESQLNSSLGGILRQSVTSQGLSQNSLQPSAGALSSSNSKPDRRRRDGCFTCKNRKKKCDCVYTFDETTGTQKCNTCLRYTITCYLTEPDWDQAEREVQLRERMRLVKLGKRKARDESDSSGNASRDQSTTSIPADTARQPAIYRSIETSTDGLGPQVMRSPPTPTWRGTDSATRGGRGGSKQGRE